MNQLKRIREIDRLIRVKESGNANKMSNRFGISERSIYRALQALKETFNIEIEYDYELDSYVYQNLQIKPLLT